MMSMLRICLLQKSLDESNIAKSKKGQKQMREMDRKGSCTITLALLIITLYVFGCKFAIWCYMFVQFICSSAPPLLYQVLAMNRAITLPTVPRPSGQCDPFPVR